MDDKAITKFNPDGKEDITEFECLTPAMKITDQEDADQYFADYVKYIDGELRKNPDYDGIDSDRICRLNIGYFAGYFDCETRGRVEHLFKCVHPVFGSIKENGIPTPDEAFKAGLKIGSKGLFKTEIE